MTTSNSPVETLGQLEGPVTQVEFELAKAGRTELYRRAVEACDGNQAETDKLLPEAINMVLKKSGTSCFLV